MAKPDQATLVAMTGVAKHFGGVRACAGIDFAVRRHPQVADNSKIKIVATRPGD